MLFTCQTLHFVPRNNERAFQLKLLGKMEDAIALPAGWKKAFSKSQQRVYFVNEELNKSVWTLEEIGLVADGSGKKRKRQEGEGEITDVRKVKAKESGTQKINLAIIVPFRDLHAEQRRKEHLDRFVTHMEEFLSNSSRIVDFHIFIVEQSDDGRKFNRGKLLNIGFELARRFEGIEFNSFVFHDVDLLPQPIILEWYERLPDAPIHIAKCWNRYNNNPKYFGGIVAFSRRDFEVLDGFPNTFWGWGGEDDELERRLDFARLKAWGPSKALNGAVIDLEAMDLTTKLDSLRKTDWKCQVKWEVLDEYKMLRNKPHPLWWGLKNLKFEEIASIELAPHTTKLTVDVLYNFNSDGSEHWANRKLHWSEEGS